MGHITRRLLKKLSFIHHHAYIESYFRENIDRFAKEFRKKRFSEFDIETKDTKIPKTRSRNESWCLKSGLIGILKLIRRNLQSQSLMIFIIFAKAIYY